METEIEMEMEILVVSPSVCVERVESVWSVWGWNDELCVYTLYWHWTNVRLSVAFQFFRQLINSFSIRTEIIKI